MSVYDQPYEVITHNLSAYVGTPEEVLRIARRTTGEVRINLGYGEVGWQDEHGTEITRRTLRRVLLSEIEYRVAKKEVASMIERLRAPHDAGGEFVIQRR